MATSVLDEKTKAKAYEQAKSGDWDAVGQTINDLAGYKEEVDSVGNVSLSGGANRDAASKYMKDLQREFGYNAEDYYSKKSSGSLSGSASTSGYGSGGSASGGGNDYTKYLEDMYAANLESEFAALKSAYDQNVLELDRQNDAIAEAYRAARNQAAQQSALERQRMNEFAVAQGLNTGTAGQMALSQNAAYLGSLGSIGAQEASALADTALTRAQLAADYQNDLNRTRSQINADRSQALYQELIRQQEAAAAAEAAAQKAIMEQEKFDYQKEQDALDYRLALAKLQQSGSNAETMETYKPRLTYAQVMDAVENGLVTDSIRNDYEYYVGTPYNPVSSVNQLSETARNLYNHYVATGGGLTDARKIDLAMAFDEGRINNDELNYILDALGVA